MKDFEPEEKQNERVILWRKNSAEERTRQRKEWRKRKREQKMANTAIARSQPPSRNREANDVLPCIPEAENAKKPRFAAPNTRSRGTKMNMASCPRGAMMVHMAVRRSEANVVHKRQQTSMTAKKTTSNSGTNFEPKELRPENIEYVAKNPVGSGSFGQCFLARYRSIKVIVKQMKLSETAEDKERARRELLHEAKIISSLGDHPNLPIIFGVVTKTLPLCLVTQFHGVEEESVTLHQAANDNKLTVANCISIFQKICHALGYLHSNGYLHNDIKANNVVLELTSVPAEYNPVLIDFGKSLKVSSAPLYRKNGNALKCKVNSYLAPEVVSERLYSVASDIYSLGRMLKAISSIVGFYPSVRELVRVSTKDKPSDRPGIEVFSHKITEVKL